MLVDNCFDQLYYQTYPLARRAKCGARVLILMRWSPVTRVVTRGKNFRIVYLCYISKTFECQTFCSHFLVILLTHADIVILLTHVDVRTF